MQIQSLGHVVLNVRDLDRSEAFYHGLLGLPISVRSDDWSMTFFTLGSHHDFAISALGANAAAAGDQAVGLAHVAFRLGGGTDALRAAKRRLEQAGLAVAAVDHRVTHSLYVKDPDGNGVELYIDADEAWKDDPQVILSPSRALEL